MAWQVLENVLYVVDVGNLWNFYCLHIALVSFVPCEDILKGTYTQIAIVGNFVLFLFFFLFFLFFLLLFVTKRLFVRLLGERE